MVAFLFFTPIAVLLGVAVVLYAKRCGSPLNSPPTEYELAALQRIFSDKPEDISLGALGSRIDGRAKSVHIGTQEHLSIIRDHLKAYVCRRERRISEPFRKQHFQSDRKPAYEVYFVLAGIIILLVIVLLFDLPFGSFTAPILIYSMGRGLLVAPGSMTEETIVLGRLPFRKVIPYSAVQNVQIDLAAGQGFTLSIESKTGSFRVFEGKLARLLVLYDTILQKRPDLNPENLPAK